MEFHDTVMIKVVRRYDNYLVRATDDAFVLIDSCNIVLLYCMVLHSVKLVLYVSLFKSECGL